ncbi:dihydrodipicolinate synthase family protein [Embleya scabrispora]|uniref:dihydrodipicolinate synthase family protein n=1 Tax=Embleya scabrispora TaxID=159449 RepID=UPI000362B30C|nr:dihydrodipicolinate synthase family protein [Embleya scabrispora]MYS84806.1 dihydrodipicolinate synthase family protein [Streptomyces sp. SID5474]
MSDAITTDRTLHPWRGLMVATPLPLHADLSIDYDAFADHVRGLVDAGCDGVVPNGSLGEYQVLTAQERARVVRVAVEAVGGDRVMPGVAAYGSAEARRWTEQAAEAGAKAVMLLPPNAYRADDAEVHAHYAEVASIGVPIVAYNNPFDTRVDLSPELLAKLHADGHIVGVKEFSGDTRRAYRIAELAPELDLLAGADDVLLELAVAGAKGWIGGFLNVLPHACIELYRAAVAGDLTRARELYDILQPLLRWDTRSEFVQAIKLSMDVVGKPGGPSRPPRRPLNAEMQQAIRLATERAVAAGLS